MDLLFTNTFNDNVFERVAERLIKDVAFDCVLDPVVFTYDDYEKIKKDVKETLKNLNFDLTFVRNLLQKRGYDSSRIEKFLEIVSEQRIELISNAIKEHNLKYGDVVDNINWKLKLVIGTSSLYDLQYPILQIEFTVINHNKDKHIKNYEFTKKELDKFITKLENTINAVKHISQ